MNNNTTPWLTKEGFFDPASFPIEGILKQAVCDDESQFRPALMMLQSMHHHGRTEAGIFLLGMLVTWKDDWEQRIAIVEAVTGITPQACVDLLFRELKRVRSSNTTRRYLTHVESGEERLLIERDTTDGSVWYDILAFSRPRHILAHLGYPWVRRLQNRFREDSGAAMQRAGNMAFGVCGR